MRKELRTQYDSGGYFHHSFQGDPGVYCIFMANTLVYVGQARSLRDRMYQLSITSLHTFRRSLGQHRFGDDPDFIAYKKPSFPPSIEQKITLHMTEHISVNTLSVRFGRIEIEEWLIHRHLPIFNVSGRKRI